MIRFALLLALLLPALVAASPPTVEKIADTIVDPTALYLPDGRWGHTTNGRSFQQDALASFNGWQYTTWFDADRRLCVARRPLDAKEWQVVRFEDYRFKGNDTHNAPVLGICPADGTVHLSFDHHGHPLHYRVSKAGVATAPDKVEWTPALFGPTTDQLEPGKRIARVTYPRFFATPQGNLQFQCRIGSSGNGEAYLADYVNGKWSNFAPLITGAGDYHGSDSRNAYENAYTYDANGNLHVTWCWREDGGPMTNHDLLYAWSDDSGQTWRNNAGETIGKRGSQLINLDTPGIRVWDIPPNRGLINSTAQAIDSRNRVHVVTRHLPDNITAPAKWQDVVPLTRYFHYWRDDAGKWHRNAMSFGGNRGQLCFDKHDNAYHIFVTDTLEISAASAASGWSDWRVIHREPGRFTDQPLLDARRGREEQVLSVYVQESGNAAAFSALRVIEYRLARGD